MNLLLFFVGVDMLMKAVGKDCTALFGILLLIFQTIKHILFFIILK